MLTSKQKIIIGLTLIVIILLIVSLYLLYDNWSSSKNNSSESSNTKNIKENFQQEKFEQEKFINNECGGGTIISTAGQVKYWTVPKGVTSATFTVIGGSGGKGSRCGIDGQSSLGGIGGKGAKITITLKVTEGQLYYICVGNNGVDGGTDANHSGAYADANWNKGGNGGLLKSTSFQIKGNGGDSIADPVISGGNGYYCRGGGGGSISGVFLLKDMNTMLRPLIISGGGGGGGAGGGHRNTATNTNPGGNGGNSGENGTSGGWGKQSRNGWNKVLTPPSVPGLGSFLQPGNIDMITNGGVGSSGGGGGGGYFGVAFGGTGYSGYSGGGGGGSFISNTLIGIPDITYNAGDLDGRKYITTDTTGIPLITITYPTSSSCPTTYLNTSPKSSLNIKRIRIFGGTNPINICGFFVYDSNNNLINFTNDSIGDFSQSNGKPVPMNLNTIYNFDGNDIRNFKNIVVNKSNRKSNNFKFTNTDTPKDYTTNNKYITTISSPAIDAYSNIWLQYNFNNSTDIYGIELFLKSNTGALIPNYKIDLIDEYNTLISSTYYNPVNTLSTDPEQLADDAHRIFVVDKDLIDPKKTKTFFGNYENFFPLSMVQYKSAYDVSTISFSKENIIALPGFIIYDENGNVILDFYYKTITNALKPETNFGPDNALQISKLNFSRTILDAIDTKNTFDGNFNNLIIPNNSSTTNPSATNQIIKKFPYLNSTDNITMSNYIPKGEQSITYYFTRPANISCIEVFGKPDTTLQTNANVISSTDTPYLMENPSTLNYLQDLKINLYSFDILNKLINSGSYNITLVNRLPKNIDDSHKVFTVDYYPNTNSSSNIINQLDEHAIIPTTTIPTTTLAPPPQKAAQPPPPQKAAQPQPPPPPQKVEPSTTLAKVDASAVAAPVAVAAKVAAPPQAPPTTTLIATASDADIKAAAADAEAAANASAAVVTAANNITGPDPKPSPSPSSTGSDPKPSPSSTGPFQDIPYYKSNSKSNFADILTPNAIVLPPSSKPDLNDYTNSYNKAISLLDDPNNMNKAAFDTYLKIQDNKIGILNKNLTSLKNAMPTNANMNPPIKGIKSMYNSKVMNVQEYNKIPSSSLPQITNALGQNMSNINNNNNNSTDTNYLIYGNNGCLQYNPTPTTQNESGTTTGAPIWNFQSCNTNEQQQQFKMNKINNMTDFNRPINLSNSTYKISNDQSAQYGFYVVNPSSDPNQCLQLNNDGLSVMPCTMESSQRFKTNYHTVLQ